MMNDSHQAVANNGELGFMLMTEGDCTTERISQEESNPHKQRTQPLLQRESKCGVMRVQCIAMCNR